MVLGPNGLITKAQEAAIKTEQAKEDELRQLTILEATTNLKNTTYFDSKGNKATVPAGFAVSKVEGENEIDTGLVIIDSQGNEFVWIPCSIDGANDTIKYDRYNFNIQTGDYDKYIEEISSDEYKSISLFNGFYIARYEAGSQIERTSESDELTSVVLKSGQYIYVWISQQNAIEQSENMKNYYNYTSSFTKLCSSYAWDTALKFIEKTNIGYSTDSTGGNHSSSGLVLTGTTTPYCNIYDMGGNAWEYTSETFSGSLSYVRRGCYFGSSISKIPAGYRIYNDGAANLGTSFRVCLYLSEK